MSEEVKIVSVEDVLWQELDENVLALKDMADRAGADYLGRLGDYCLDEGRQAEHDAIRWLVDNGRRPWNLAYEEGDIPETKVKVAWFNGDEMAEGLGDPASDLPAAVFTQLAAGQDVACHRFYESTSAAIRDFVTAHVKAVAGGWDRSPEVHPVPLEVPDEGQPQGPSGDAA